MRPPLRNFRGIAAVALLGCGGTISSPAEHEGPDTALPFPLDAADAPGEPGTYKGLPLRLVDTGEPEVTPVDGVIGVVCIGMSNATQECSEFISQVRGSLAGEINPQVRVADCAVGGHAIERWIDPAFDDRLWDDCIARKVPAAGIRPDQVRVLYHKAANQFTTGPGNAPRPPYPSPESDYYDFLENLEMFADRVRTEFPSVLAVYTTSRSYGGYAGNQAGRGEPLSYEEGHALNTWLAGNREVDGVWYGWGPYIWAPDCADGMNGTGMCYVRTDYVADGVHPAPSGRSKVARAIHERLLQHAWYRRQ